MSWKPGRWGLNVLSFSRSSARKEANALLLQKGVNSLFVAIGTLTWNVAEKSKELISSPILLIPVELRKTSRKEEYTLYSTEEEVSLNPVLVQKLSTEFGITLPEIEIERNLGYDELLNGVRQAVADRPNWTVENTAYISLFQRTKAAMIRDIEQLEQNEKIIATHPILQALAGIALLSLWEEYNWHKSLKPNPSL